MDNKELQDWQLGNESYSTPLMRVDLMNEWLKKNKQDILNQRKPIELEEPKYDGFDNLKMFD
jgi:hypothetical protein